MPAPNFRALSLVDGQIVAHARLDDALQALRDEHVTWIDLFGRDEANERLLGPDGLGIHPLIVEDVFNDCVRPKIEDYQSYLYLLFHAPSLQPRDDDPATLDLTEIDVLLGDFWVVTHHAQPSAAMDAVFSEIERTGRGLRKGAGWVAHAVIDRIIDDYIPLLDQLDDTIEELEQKVLHDTGGPDILQQIFSIKRQLQQLRRVSVHQKEVLYRLSRGEFDEIPEQAIPYFRDIYDHFVRVSDLAESYRDLIAGTFEAHLSVQSNKMNAIMKTLTLATTIFNPLTFLAGVYGMNFEHMPELKKPWAYPLTLGAMALIALSVFWFYKKKKWI
ncbi:MAG: magnesium/cobalt transporter CorA [Myxococcales bacterium]|nr:magnesium/cobalt transporter CorA [Myxococcales bacterium]